MESGNIKPINHSSVHKICSGQVVLTLATAVKELVENSIDAGATIIEVKLKEYGSEQIEVVDNGKGVKKSDFQSITLKHHTSKISDFSDVEFVSTFGFRGEALSSLCALSNVEITTCYQDSKVGSLLIYDHDGILVKSTPVPRQVGTTVIIKNLFFTLPVRHKEFLRNNRKEYLKMIQMLTAYCLISTNKRITCTNVTDKGKKSIVLSTNCCNTYKENISCIFGSKQVNNLMEFVQHAPSESVLEEYFVPKSAVEKCELFRIEGYISSSTHGEGRSSADRQFFFINGRPCDFPKISKLINEIYHSFNKAQYPFIFLNVAVTEGSADVNVTPDKRQIFVQEEKLLLCIIKTSVLQMYHVQPSQMKVSSSSFFFQKCKTENGLEQLKNTEEISVSSQGLNETLKRKADCNSSIAKEDSHLSPPFKSFKKDDLNSACGSDLEVVNKSALNSSCEKDKKMSNNGPGDIRDSPDSGFASLEDASDYSPCHDTQNTKKSVSPKIIKNDYSHSTNVNVALTLPFKEEKAFSVGPHSKSRKLNLKNILQNAYRGENSARCLKTSTITSKVNKLKTDSNDNIENFFSKNSPKKSCADSYLGASDIIVTADKNSSETNYSKEAYEPVDKSVGEEHLLLDEHQPRKKKCKIIAFDIETLKRNLESKRKNNSSENSVFRKFRSRIAPTDNDSAEQELKKEIKKEDFSNMNIIGQFNLGFIITRLNDDLFIIDQHATDEKYNYEMLQKETILETQKLLNPQSLNLTAASEAVLLDNVHIFEKSGFKFSINEENSVGNKVQLVSVPVSHNWRFGKEDVDEMIFMLTDNPISMVRPSRINQMFASRACRKSVMIGTALTVPMMKKLVLHMGEIEQPWNCPHGRPTMRHLFNLNIVGPV